MPLSPATALLTLVACAIVVAGTWSWIIAATKAALTWRWLPRSIASHAETALKAAGLSPRLPLIGWSDRRPVPWALIDLIGLVGLWLFASLAVSLTAHSLGWIEATSDLNELSLNQRTAVILGNVAISLFIAGAGLAIVALRTHATLRDLGWSWSDIASDLRLGLIGFVMLAPPTYALQGLLVWLWKPSKHPLMEMFKGTPDIGFFMLLFVSAAIVAPLFEELMFRVVLQGFLEKSLVVCDDLNELLIGSSAGRVKLFDGIAGGNTTASATIAGARLEGAAADIDPNPYASPFPLAEQTDTVVRRNSSSNQPELRGPRAWLPIAISSAVFALLHYSHGPDWIPLLFLAAGLGYLYQHTHRLLPSLTVHAALNSLSLWGLWVQVHEGFRP